MVFKNIDNNPIVYPLEYDEILENGVHIKRSEVFEDKHMRQKRYEYLQQFEIEGLKNKDDYQGVMINLLVDRKKWNTPSRKHKHKYPNTLYVNKLGETLYITPEMINKDILYQQHLKQEDENKDAIEVDYVDHNTEEVEETPKNNDETINLNVNQTNINTQSDNKETPISENKPQNEVEEAQIIEDKEKNPQVVENNQTETSHLEDEDEKKTSIPNDLTVYERLYNIENKLMEHLKKYYEIPENIDDTELLHLVQNNFTISKIGNLDVQNWDELIKHNPLELYNYTDIDKDGNIINTSIDHKNGIDRISNKKGKEYSTAIVLNPKPMHNDMDLDDFNKANEISHNELEELSQLRNLRNELNHIKPQILKDIYNDDVEKRLDYLKHKLQNTKEPMKFDRINNTIKSILKNKYLFVGAAIFWPSGIVVLGALFIGFKLLETALKIKQNIYQQQRIKKTKKEINKTIDGLNYRLSDLYKKGENLSMIRAKLMNTEKSDEKIINTVPNKEINFNPFKKKDKNKDDKDEKETI